MVETRALMKSNNAEDKNKGELDTFANNIISISSKVHIAFTSRVATFQYSFWWYGLFQDFSWKNLLIYIIYLSYKYIYQFF